MPKLFAIRLITTIDKLGNPCQYQLEYLIYGRLIATISIYNILYLLMYKVFKRSMSILSFVKLFRTHCTIFMKISNRSLHEKRRRKTTLEILQEHLFLKKYYQIIA